MQFRKKPIVIEAFQFQQPTSVDEAPEWLIEAIRRDAFLVVDSVAHITTLNGVTTAQPGDWIVRGVKGELYPCKPDIFEATYEPAEIAAAQTPIRGLTFGTALTALKTGQRVARAGWNGKDMFVYLVPAASYPVRTGAAKAHFGEGAMVPYNAYLALKGADDTVSTWAPSGSDALADDWLIVEGTASQRPPYQQRVIDEKRELDEKLAKLVAFFNTPLFAGLDEEERQRLEHQAAAMQEYSTILGERIAAFAPLA